MAVANGTMFSVTWEHFHLMFLHVPAYQVFLSKCQLGWNCFREGGAGVDLGGFLNARDSFIVAGKFSDKVFKFLEADERVVEE